MHALLHSVPQTLQQATADPHLRQRLLDGTNRTLCTRTQEKGGVTQKETDPDLPRNVKESPVEATVGGGMLQGWGQ